MYNSIPAAYLTLLMLTSMRKTVQAGLYFLQVANPYPHSHASTQLLVGLAADLLQVFTWLAASPAAEQAAAAAASAAAGHSGSSTAGRLPPVYGCHATNTSAQLDLDAAAQTLAAVPAADARLVQLLDDGLGCAVRAFGRPGPAPRLSTGCWKPTCWASCCP
jgi:hypothetical protein